jgi:hypothetical protein
MKKLSLLLTIGALLAPLAPVHAGDSDRSLSIRAESISGFPSGEMFLSGGGTFDPQSGFLRVRGSFRCTQDIAQGPLAGCRAGDGVRWEGANIVPSTGFLCTGATGEAVKTATTDGSTLVMQAEFYRQGDGVLPSFRGRMIVSTVDLDPDQPGLQNIWVEGLGCGTATVSVR